jgi:hypothetical protein
MRKELTVVKTASRHLGSSNAVSLLKACNIFRLSNFSGCRIEGIWLLFPDSSNLSPAKFFSVRTRLPSKREKREKDREETIEVAISPVRSGTNPSDLQSNKKGKFRYKLQSGNGISRLIKG